MDQLVAMRVFVRIADRSSFAQAADDLDISRAAASGHVAALEKLQLLEPDRIGAQSGLGAVRRRLVRLRRFGVRGRVDQRQPKFDNAERLARLRLWQLRSHCRDGSRRLPERPPTLLQVRPPWKTPAAEQPSSVSCE